MLPLTSNILWWSMEGSCFHGKKLSGSEVCDARFWGVLCKDLTPKNSSGVHTAGHTGVPLTNS